MLKKEDSGDGDTKLTEDELMRRIALVKESSKDVKEDHNDSTTTEGRLQVCGKHSITSQ